MIRAFYVWCGLCRNLGIVYEEHGVHYLLGSGRLWKGGGGCRHPFIDEHWDAHHIGPRGVLVCHMEEIYLSYRPDHTQLTERVCATSL